MATIFFDCFSSVSGFFRNHAQPKAISEGSFHVINVERKFSVSSISLETPGSYIRQPPPVYNPQPNLVKEDLPMDRYIGPVIIPDFYPRTAASRESCLKSMHRMSTYSIATASMYNHFDDKEDLPPVPPLRYHRQISGPAPTLESGHSTIHNDNSGYVCSPCSSTPNKCSLFDPRLEEIPISPKTRCDDVFPSPERPKYSLFPAKASSDACIKCRRSLSCRHSRVPIMAKKIHRYTKAELRRMCGETKVDGQFNNTLVGHGNALGIIF